jgi:hypothetical protein
MSAKTYPSPRVYNQILSPRKYVKGKRRFSVYWTWSYPWEANRDVTELDNRFSTMTECVGSGGPLLSQSNFLKKCFCRALRGRWSSFILAL